MCGSHNGTDEHREVVLSNLETAGNEPSDLKCGTHVPLFMQYKKIYPQNGEDKDPTRHNCSGKHSGFLAQAVYLGDDKAEYLNPESKTQKWVKKMLSEFCEYPENGMPCGVDGCSAPNYPLSLKAMALGFMKLTNLKTSDTELKTALSRVREAMYAYPEMISGEMRFDYDLARSFPNNMICKVGAESIEGIGLADPPLGIAVKIHDGNRRALAPVCIEVLKQLGIIKDIKDYPYLVPNEKPEVINNREIVTGHVVADFKLKKA